MNSVYAFFTVYVFGANVVRVSHAMSHDIVRHHPLSSDGVRSVNAA